MPLSLLSQLWEPNHLEIALQYEGVTEVTKNSSPEIDMFLKYVGLSPGNPYCSSFVSYCIGEANVDEPTVRSGLARKFILKESIPASKVLLKQVEIPTGSIVVWKQGNTVFGHVGFTTLNWIGKEGYTIEANTGSGNTGSQRDGEGIYQRRRNIVPGAAFRITHFTLVKYK
jgi:hypothetical protein